jgi:predicted ATPase
MELLGREMELAGMDRAVDDARAGGAHALGLFGEAGIGKSALLGALRERAEAAGMLVLEGRAAAHERSVPFGLVVDALDDHVATLHPRRVESVGPDLAAVLPAAAKAERVSPAGPRVVHRAIHAGELHLAS